MLVGYIGDDDVYNKDMNKRTICNTSFTNNNNICLRKSIFVLLNKVFKYENDNLLSSNKVYKDKFFNEFIGDCSTLLYDIENDTQIGHDIIYNLYHDKFLELENLVIHSIEYTHMVKDIG